MVIVVRERWRRRRTNARRAEAVEVGVVAIVIVAGREDLLVRLGGGHFADGEGMNWMTRGGGDDEMGGTGRRHRRKMIAFKYVENV